MKQLFKDFRHLIVKLITPNLYRNAVFVENQRPMIIEARKIYGSRPLVGVEIGTFRGENAKTILTFLDIEKLYLVDPYVGYAQPTGAVFSAEKMEESFHIAKQTLECFEEKICWIKQCSSKAAASIQDNLDFVYIDGGHSYEDVKTDIAHYYPKVKSGGIIGGHDYSSSFRGLVKAVNEFVKEQNLKLNIAAIDWWVIKQ